jgi:PAS domain S-box-containing protein
MQNDRTICAVRQLNQLIMLYFTCPVSGCSMRIYFADDVPESLRQSLLAVNSNSSVVDLLPVDVCSSAGFAGQVPLVVSTHIDLDPLRQQKWLCQSECVLVCKVNYPEAIRIVAENELPWQLFYLPDEIDAACLLQLSRMIKAGTKQSFFTPLAALSESIEDDMLRHEALDQLLLQLVDLLPVAAACLFQMEEKGAKAKQLVCHQKGEENSRTASLFAMQLDLSRPGFSEWRENLLQKQCLRGSGEGLNSAQKTLFRAAGKSDYILLPLHVNQRLWGILLFSGGQTATILHTQLEAIGGVIELALARQTMKRELQAAEERFRMVADLLTDGILIITDRRIAWANQRAILMLGGKRLSDLFEQPLEAFMQQSARLKFNQLMQHYEGQPGSSFAFHFILQRLDGASLDIEQTIQMFDFLGQRSGFVVLRDITTLRQSEKERMRLAALVEQAAEAILITDTDGRIEYVNRAFEEISGYSRAEAIGGNPSILKSDKHDEGFYRELWQQINQGNVWRGTFVNREKSGKLYYENAVIFPIKDSEGKIQSFASVKRDITRERELEIRANRHERLEAIGKLAGGVSHDFNNIITAIYGFLTIAKSDSKNAKTLAESLDGIEDSAKRAASLIRQLLAFSRRQVIQPEVLQSAQIIHNLHRMLDRLIGDDIRLTFTLADNLFPIFADAGQVEQVLLNLVVNAGQAIAAKDHQPDEKAITVTAVNRCHEQAVKHESFTIIAGDYLEIRVIDTGIGMTEQTQRHIFEPFFTTRAQEDGTGLGLSTVYGIIKQNDGYIMVESEFGNGSSFTVLWPAHLENQETTDTAPQAGSVVRGGNELILFVEDDKQILEFADIYLRRLGYDVILAGNGVEALEKVKKTRKPIDLLLTDLVMPLMGGLELAAEMRRQQAGLKVIYASGHIEKVLGERASDAATQVISKPYKIHELAQVIRSVLDKPADA